MRTEQERMELIRKKTLEIRKKEQKRRQRITGVYPDGNDLFSVRRMRDSFVIPPAPKKQGESV